jgi:hypothetical protein
LHSVEEELARGFGRKPILSPELHLRRAERLIEMELAQEQAERSSPHQQPLRRLTLADRFKIQAMLDELLGMIRRSTEARRDLRGRPRWQKVQWEGRLWRLVRLLRARLDAFPGPHGPGHRSGSRAWGVGERGERNRRGRSAAAAGGVPAEILDAYQTGDE